MCVYARVCAHAGASVCVCVCVCVCAAKRGAVCNTDHHLVCAKLRLLRAQCRRRSSGGGAKGKKYNVEKLIVSRGKDEEGEAVRSEYLEKVLERAREDWSKADGVDEKWSAVLSALVITAEDVLGRAGRPQPDWFRESLDELKPLLTLRNTAYSRWF